MAWFSITFKHNSDWPPNFRILQIISFYFSQETSVITSGLHLNQLLHDIP